MEKIFITGGAGYIGSHTCKALKQSGYLPVAFDNLSSGHASFVKWGPLIVGDVLDTVALTNAMIAHQPAAVIHFAGSAYVGESVSQPQKYYKNNVAGALSLTEAMHLAGLTKLVFSSTCAIYGNSSVANINEDDKPLPINPYGRSKLMVEQIFNDLSSSGEFRFVALRYFNAAGADTECEIGEAHDPEPHLIPLAIRSARPDASTLKVFGQDFPTPDGTAIRDYIHVEDLAKAHILALDYLLSGKNSISLNIGTGRGTSVLEIINCLKALGLDVRSEVAPRRDGDPGYLVANADKARKILGWTPDFTDIKEILKTAIKWHAKELP
jgi:UDP-glucose-4-epimerase GalE